MSYPQESSPTGPRPQPPVGPVARWDRETERRHAALTLAVTHCDGYPAMDVVEMAEKFYEFLTKKRQPAKEE